MEKFSWEQHRATSALQAILAWHPFLECAALAKVDLLVAGDKDLLILGVYKGTVCR